MKNTGWTRTTLALSYLSLATIAFPILVGCGGGNPPAASTAANTPAANTNTNKPATLAQGVTVVENGVGTEPAQSVAIFLDSLRRGDERAANGVLSSKARDELAKTAYVIEPLGTPAGKYSIGRIGFPYEDKSVALVECLWTEPASDTSESISMDIVCEVHQEPEGWRISGMGVTIPGTDEALVLDFEDAASLQATIDAATGQTSQSPPPSVANGTQVASQSLPSFELPQLPPIQQAAQQQQQPYGLPALPASNQSFDNVAPPQTAMPPQYNTPLRR